MSVWGPDARRSLPVRHRRRRRPEVPPAPRGGPVWLGWVLCARCALACSAVEPAAPGSAVEPPQASFGAIPSAPVSGQVLGAAFAVRSASYVVDDRPGRERVDLVLSPAPPSGRCPAVVRDAGPRLWLRRWGRAPMADRQVRLGGPGGEAWELHYEQRIDGRWVSSRAARALIEVHAPGPERRVQGALSVCFGDPSGSCVSGSFVAHACRLDIFEPLRQRALPPSGR